ncbi:MAG: hypothetical protein ACQEVA_07000 [Myxococcota bacterium]
MNQPLERLASLLVLSLVLMLFAGCNIYRSVDEPPQDEGDTTDVVDDDAAFDAAQDTAQDSGDDAAQDTAEDTTQDTAEEDIGDGTTDTETPDTEDASDCVPVGDPNEATYYCDLTNSECGDITVEDDCGDIHDVNCGTCASGESCTGSATEHPRICECDCEIGGDCYSDGSVNPANPCEICDPATDTTGWTSNEGGACDDGDGVACTGVCVSGTCESELRDGTCLIDDTCWDDGEQNTTNECEVCITAESQTDWSPSNAFSCGGTSSCTCNQSFECVKINGNPCN